VNAAGSVDLYWLPLGAGGHSVRYNGKIFEAVAARLAHRSRQDLYHAALEVSVSEARFIIEQAPGTIMVSSPLGRSVRVLPDAFASSATRSAAGPGVSSPMSTRPSRARGG
jgi:hypothetical protein